MIETCSTSQNPNSQNSEKQNSEKLAALAKISENHEHALQETRNPEAIANHCWVHAKGC